MIDKIKSLMQTDEVVGEVNTKIEELANKIDNLNKTIIDTTSEIADVKNDLKQLKQEHTQLFKDAQVSVQNAHEMLTVFQKEVYDFKLLKSQMQENIIKKFEEEMRDHLKLNTEKLNEDLAQYLDVRKNTDEMVASFLDIKQEAQKLSSISKNIKEADFELNKYAHQLRRSDSEKLQLMRRIEKLEMLISKMRRSKSMQQRVVR